MPLAPPAARPADRRSALTRARGAALVVAVMVAVAAGPVMAGCAGSDDARPGGDDTVVDEGSAGTPTGSGATPSDAASGSAPTVVASSAPTGSESPDSTAVSMPGGETASVVPAGFTTIRGEVTDADGAVCEVCLWLADTSSERSRGLMGVTDLGGADGMAFVWDSPTTGNFFMFRTPTPLSIAWFAADGSYVAEADMAPCLDDDSSRCERYGPGAAYTVAVEVFQGGLADLGITPGSTLTLDPATESPTCP